jgi:hypothetical protein
MSGEFMATSCKLKPPTRQHPAWVAFAVVFPALLVALLSSPIWMSAYVAMRLMKAGAGYLKRNAPRSIGLCQRRISGLIRRTRVARLS